MQCLNYLNPSEFIMIIPNKYKTQTRVELCWDVLLIRTNMTKSVCSSANSLSIDKAKHIKKPHVLVPHIHTLTPFR